MSFEGVDVKAFGIDFLFGHSKHTLADEAPPPGEKQTNTGATISGAKKCSQQLSKINLD